MPACRVVPGLKFLLPDGSARNDMDKKVFWAHFLIRLFKPGHYRGP
jgi:hypothetical protein